MKYLMNCFRLYHTNKLKSGKFHASIEIILHKNNVEFFENFTPELKLFLHKNTAIYGGTIKLNDFRIRCIDSANN